MSALGHTLPAVCPPNYTGHRAGRGLVALLGADQHGRSVLLQLSARVLAGGGVHFSGSRTCEPGRHPRRALHGRTHGLTLALTGQPAKKQKRRRSRPLPGDVHAVSKLAARVGALAATGISDRRRAIILR